MRAHCGLFLVLCACDGTGTGACDGGSSLPDPVTAFAPSPDCAALHADEIAAMSEACDLDAFLGCYRLNPWDVVIDEGRSIAYLEYITMGDYQELHEGIECPRMLRYRLDLRTGTIGLIGNICINQARGELLSQSIEARGVAHHHLCERSARLGLEVRALQTRIPLATATDEGFVAAPSWRPAIFVREEASGAALHALPIVAPRGQTLVPLDRHVSSPDPTRCCDWPLAIGCAVQCGGDVYHSAECTGTERLVAEDGFCHVQPVP